MYKKLLPVLVLLCVTSALQAQTHKLTGTVRDTTARANVKNAVVALLSPKDSILKAFTRTSDNGSYQLKPLPEGKYIFMVMHPSFADYVEDIDVKQGMAEMPAIPLTPKSKLLEAVILKSGSPIRIKGDTTVYTADSFKVSANANVEELLKKMPGFQVDKNGQIKSMGEVVEKVLVDGEEFFGDDPGMAVKNLRADAVKEVQVFNKKSDQAEFTGIDDGKTQKTINLKLKEDKKTGYFGKVDLAGGLMKSLEDRYNTNTMFSAFKGKRKFTGFLLTGNTGQDGLSWQDNEKFGGENDNISVSMDEDGGVMYMWKGGSSDDEPYVNTQNGFIKNINAGAQYSNKWNDKTTLNLSPKYNSQEYNNFQQMYNELFDQPQVPIKFSRKNTDTYVNRHNIKTSGSYDIKIDSNNTLKLTARANFYKTESEELTFRESLDKDTLLVNRSNNNVRTDSEKQSLSASAIFKHKFKKARRTLSFNMDWNLLNTDGNNFLRSNNEAYKNGAATVTDIDQLRVSEKSTQRTSGRLVYTEPLTKKYSLELSHEYSYSYGKNNQVTSDFNPLTNRYDEVVDTLTNDFISKITINKPGAKISFNDKKVKFSFGSGFGITNFDLMDKTKGINYKRDFTNIFPSANLNYTYKSNHNLRFNYNGNTTQPTISQLQPLPNNTLQFEQYIGNADLKPSFSNQFNINHNSYNFLKDMWMYQGLNFRFTSNAITNSITYDSTGKSISQPINTDGNFSAGFWGGGGFKSKKLDMRFNFGPNFNFNKSVQVINGITSFSKTLNAGMNLWINKMKDKKYDFNIGNEIGYNVNEASQNGVKTRYTTYVGNIDATVYYKKVWSIQSDYNYSYRGRVGGADPFNNQLWNARLQRTFNNNQFTAYVRVRDILNQNVGLERSFWQNSLTETRNERLKRYWMVGFTWDFKNKGAAPAPAAAQ